MTTDVDPALAATRLSYLAAMWPSRIQQVLYRPIYLLYSVPVSMMPTNTTFFIQVC